MDEGGLTQGREDRPFGTLGRSAGLYLTEVKCLFRIHLLRRSRSVRNSRNPGRALGPLLASDGGRANNKEVGAMNTTWTRQYLLGQFGKAGAILHHGLALIGLVAILLVIVRGKSLFYDSDEHQDRSATIGAIHYDGAVSLFEGAEEADSQKYRALASYVSRRYRIAPDVTEVFVGAAHEAGQI